VADIVPCKKAALVPLTVEEGLSWRGHKIRFDQFGEAFKKVLLSLVDCLERELYREEYGPGADGWDKFWRTSPWFKALSRRTKSNHKKYVETVAELSSRVDNAELARLSPYAVRVLKQIVKNPVWQGELVNFMLDAGVQPEQINEASIDRYYARFLQQKESEDAERQELGPLFVAAALDNDEEQAEQARPQDEQALVTLADDTQKKPDRVVRVLEYGRLLAKNASKIDDAELQDPEVRQSAWDVITQLEQAVRGMKSRLRRFDEEIKAH
jgi:hypothetical protein